MKAVVQARYGRPAAVLQLEEIATPVPQAGEVLVRMRAAGVNPLDWHLVAGTPYMARLAMGRGRPKGSPVRGAEVAGVVEALGAGVRGLKAGDEVFGFCDGAFADFVAAPEDRLVVKPPEVGFEEAATVPIAAITALQGLRDHGKLRSGQRLLVVGASGGVGIFAVQIGKAFGAHVTGVCSGRNVEMVQSLGADGVIDYTREDFTTGGDRYDVVLDNIGSKPISAVRRVLAPQGTLVYNSGASMRRIVLAQMLSRFGQKVFMFLARPNQADLAVLRELMVAGRLRSVIDRTYPLAETTAAVEYVEQGHARGKVAVVGSRDP
jgi:NADPH:quinone reductase-like Zn-dependent oxidoreductase